MSSIPFAVHSLNPFDRIENSAHCCGLLEPHPSGQRRGVVERAGLRAELDLRQAALEGALVPRRSESRSASPHGAASAAQSR